IPMMGTLAVINCHLIFNSKSLLEAELKKDMFIRQNEVLQQNICFNEIFRTLVLDLPTKPDYVIYLGDFNYRMVTTEKIDRKIDAFDLAEAFETRPSLE